MLLESLSMRTDNIKVVSMFWAFSVTRFGKMSPIWRNKLRLWQNVDGLISIWKNFESTLAKFYAIGQIFMIVHGKILKSCQNIWSLC